MKSSFIHRTFFRLLWPLVQGLIIYVLLLLVFDNIEQLVNNIFTGELTLCVLLSYINNELLRLFWLILAKWNLQEDGHRNIWSLGGGVVLSVIVIGSIISLYFIYLVNYSWGVFDVELYTFVALFGFSTLFLAAVYVSFNLLNTRNLKKIEEEDVLRANLEHRVQTFRNNINPSFFYQSMESLIQMLYRDSQMADQFINHLSVLYRYILANKDEELKSLQEELSVLESLHFVLTVGHERPIHFINKIEQEEIRPEDPKDSSVSVSANAFTSVFLVTNTLNTYLSYLVNNSMVSVEQPYEVLIYIEDGYLVLESNLQDRFVKNKDMEQRYAMLKEAFEYFTPSPIIHLRKGNKRFDKIPLLTLDTQKPLIREAI